jgi:hypothetical protein
MSTPEPESITLKLRSIEVAIDNFRARMQSSFNSQVSLLKERVERINSKLASVASKAGLPQANADLSAIVQETKGILQKDLLHDTIGLFNEKLTELEGLIERLKTLSTDESTVRQSAIAQQRILGKSIPNSLWRDTAETNDNKDDDNKDKEIASLREEVNRLYNLTEREPRFQPFWILRDAHPDSVPITKIARTLNATPSEVLEDLKIFERLGLIEIKEGEARATKLVRPNKVRTE